MNIIKEIVLDSIEMLLFLGVFQAVYIEKKFIIQNKFKMGLFCILSVIVTYWSTFNINTVYHILFLSVFHILLLTFITKIRISSSAVIYFLFLTIILITEYFTLTIEMLTLNINSNQIISNSRYLSTFLVVSKTLQIFIVAMLFKFNLYFTKLKLFEEEGSLFSNLIFQVGFLGLFIFSVNIGSFDIKNIKIFNTIIFTIYFLFLLISFKDLKEKEKIININSNYKIQEYQIKNMEEIINIIRKEKHDFANHINVIRGLCLLNKPNTVERINDYVIKISETLHS